MRATSSREPLLWRLGVALVAHSIRLFVRLGHGTLAPWDPTRELVSAGAYRYSRNPMKAGLFLVLAARRYGCARRPFSCGSRASSLVNVVYIRLHEEPGLRARFGAAVSRLLRARAALVADARNAQRSTPRGALHEIDVGSRAPLRSRTRRERFAVRTGRST